MTTPTGRPSPTRPHVVYNDQLKTYFFYDKRLSKYRECDIYDPSKKMVDQLRVDEEVREYFEKKANNSDYPDGYRPERSRYRALYIGDVELGKGSPYYRVHKDGVYIIEMDQRSKYETEYFMNAIDSDGKNFDGCRCPTIEWVQQCINYLILKKKAEKKEGKENG